MGNIPHGNEIVPDASGANLIKKILCRSGPLSKIKGGADGTRRRIKGIVKRWDEWGHSELEGPIFL